MLHLKEKWLPRKRFWKTSILKRDNPYCQLLISWARVKVFLVHPVKPHCPDSGLQNNRKVCSIWLTYHAYTYVVSPFNSLRTANAYWMQNCSPFITLAEKSTFCRCYGCKALLMIQPLWICKFKCVYVSGYEFITYILMLWFSLYFDYRENLISFTVKKS